MDCNLAPQKYALIIGNGRSGTNWLLSMLDASSQTHCRNEPQDIPSSPFHSLPSAAQLQDSPELMAERWNNFVEWTGSHMGERDHRIKAPKHHVHSLAQKLGVAHWPVRPKIRKALELVWPGLRKGEWTMPWWIGEQDKLKQAYSIFKINDFRAWYVRWLLREYTDLPIIHLARHPGGQLNSGINRFFSHLDKEELEQERQLYTGILRTVIEFEPEWREIFGYVDGMELIEAVAWFWRYNNEEILKVGKKCPNYMFITYEKLAEAPISYAKGVYAFCNVPWGEDVESSITEGLSVSMWGKVDQKRSAIASSWKSKLDVEHQNIASRVLKGSILETFWEDKY